MSQRRSIQAVIPRQLAARSYVVYALALGLLGDLRDRDDLLRFGAWFNVDATTEATHEILSAACGCRARGSR